MTRKMEIISVRSTSDNEARMVGVRSEAIRKLIAAGMDACNCGSKSLTRSTVSMTLAPGCLEMMSKTDGLPLKYPALRKSCTESTTSPKSERRTAAPLR